MNSQKVKPKQKKSNKKEVRYAPESEREKQQQFMNDDEIDEYIYEDDDFEEAPQEEQARIKSESPETRIDIDNDENIPDMRGVRSAKSRVSSNTKRPNDRLLKTQQNGLKKSEGMININAEQQPFENKPSVILEDPMEGNKPRREVAKL